MSYIDDEKKLDRAVVFMTSAAAKRDELPVASVLHSVRVGLYLQRNGAPLEVVLAGILHDVVEDTDTSVEELQAAFGPRVAEPIGAMTFDDELEEAERSRDSVDRCKSLGKDALALKAADLVDNLRTYLPEANPSRLPQLSESLKYFLDASGEELGQEESWKEVRGLHEGLLARIDGSQKAR